MARMQAEIMHGLKNIKKKKKKKKNSSTADTEKKRKNDRLLLFPTSDPITNRKIKNKKRMCRKKRVKE